jgi:hypothetical protein
LIGSKIHVKVKKILRICHKKFCEYGPCKTISKENEKQTKKYFFTQIIKAVLEKKRKNKSGDIDCVSSNTLKREKNLD